ncbi:MAG: PilZ domain-containing protein [Acidobacteriales bacterium]|nr:PilZ domain-containing protein [Terriglobales bacterium]
MNCLNLNFPNPGRVPSTPKMQARVALLDLSPDVGSLLADSFKKMSIEPVHVSGDLKRLLAARKFEAAVVKLTGDAGVVLEAARTSSSNSRMILYGLGGSAQEVLRYSRYGLNAVFLEPLERQAVLRLVRATRNLVLHEYRHYVRIPLLTEVTLSCGSRTLVATSREISCGGLSLRCDDNLAAGQPLELSFTLLRSPEIHVRGTVVWRKGATAGIRYDSQDERKFLVKDWIESYLKA